MRTFESLDVWKEARNLRNRVSKLVEQFPDQEMYRLKDQLVRASRSIGANIAEGYGRYHYQENKQFCRQARGSLFELLDHLIVARDEQFISDETFESLREDLMKLNGLLNGYIAYIEKQQEQSDE